jgi:GT2 family glycosyltransferase
MNARTTPAISVLVGFDDAFINGFEDLDFCFRARNKDLIHIYPERSHPS